MSLVDEYVCLHCGYKTNRPRKNCPVCNNTMIHIVKVKPMKKLPNNNKHEIRLWRGKVKVAILRRLGKNRCEVMSLQAYGGLKKGVCWITYESNLQIPIKTFHR